MQKNVTSQKALFFAFDSTTNLPKTGDATNITAYVQIDFGTVTAISDTSATELDATNAKGYYVVDLTQAETNGDTLLFTAKSSTANIVVVGAPAVVYTVPANFSLESIDSSGRVDVIKIAGTTQTARDIGASVLLSSGTGTGQLDFTSGVVKGNVTQLLGTAWLTPAVAGTPDVNTKLIGGTASVGTAGYVGVDWGQVTNKTTSNALTGTSISTSQTIATVTNQLTAAQIATGVWQDSTGTDFTTASSIGKALYTGNFVPGAAGGLFIAGTNAATTITGALTTTFTGNLTGSIGSITNGAINSNTFSAGAITNATFSADSMLQAIRANLTQSGSTSSTVKLDASASGTADFYKGAVIRVSGAVPGQTRLITGYNETNKVATITPNWATTPTAGDDYVIMPYGSADVTAIRGSSAVGAAGYVGVDWANIAAPTTSVNLSGTTISTSQAITSVSGAVGSVTGAVGSVTARVTANTDQLAGQTVTAAAGVTFPSSLASPTNITAATGIVLAGVTHTGAVIPLVTTTTTVTGQLTGAEIATAIWQDSTGTDFTTASSIGKSLYTGNVAPGGSNGLMISGTNAGTTTLGALTITGATTHTGNVVLSDGLTINAPSTTDRAGITIVGNGTGSGIISTGGATGNGVSFVGGASGHGLSAAGTGTTKHGIVATGGSTTSHGISATGGGVGHGILATSGGGSTGDGIRLVAASTNGHGLNSAGIGTGSGVISTGGPTGHGFELIGGATSGNGMKVSGTAGNSIGLNILGQGSAAGLSTRGGATGEGMALIGGGTSGNAITTSATSGTTYINSNLTHVSGTINPALAGYVAVDWGQLVNKTASNNLSATTIATVTNQLTGSQIATSIWQDSTGTDFTTASSIGKALYTGNFVPGAAGGLFIAGTNAATTITTGLTTTFTGNLTGSVGSVATGGITAASFAADAISSTAVSAAAVAKIWAQAMTELSAVPGVTADALSALSFIFETVRNKITQTATTQLVYKDDGTTTLATSTVSDDGTTFTRGKFS